MSSEEQEWTRCKVCGGLLDVQSHDLGGDKHISRLACLAEFVTLIDNVMLALKKEDYESAKEILDQRVRHFDSERLSHQNH